jgi:hypothetical protein
VPPWAVAIAVVAALLPATWLGAHRLIGSHPTGSTPSAGRSSDLPVPPESSSASTSPAAPATTAIPTPTPATPSTTAAPLPPVRPDTPRRLSSGTLIDTGFDSSVTAIEPASSSEVARLGTRGSPGSPGTDTVYVVGAVRPDGASAFARLASLRVGRTVSIRTDSGTLTYTVRATALQPVATLAGDALFTEHRPGRLVLVGIRYDASGNRLPDALVVTAELTGAEIA